MKSVPPTGWPSPILLLKVPLTSRENGVIVDLTGEENTINDSVIRGGMKPQKRDLETGLSAPQGGATLEGAVFEITNISSSPVLVEGKTIST